LQGPPEGGLFLTCFGILLAPNGPVCIMRAAPEWAAGKLQRAHKITA